MSCRRLVERAASAWSPASVCTRRRASARTSRGPRPSTPSRAPPATGRAETRTRSAREPLNPGRPASRTRSGSASSRPYRVYNTLTFGVPGTAMASFEILSPADRWNLAFYVFRLGHEGEPRRGPGGDDARRHGRSTDREMLASPAGGVASRRPCPRSSSCAGRRRSRSRRRASGIDRTRGLVRERRRRPSPPAGASRPTGWPSTPTCRASSRWSRGSARATPRGRRRSSPPSATCALSMARGETADRVRARASPSTGGSDRRSASRPACPSPPRSSSTSAKGSRRRCWSARCWRACAAWAAPTPRPLHPRRLAARRCRQERPPGGCSIGPRPSARISES